MWKSIQLDQLKLMQIQQVTISLFYTIFFFPIYLYAIWLAIDTHTMNNIFHLFSLFLYCGFVIRFRLRWQSILFLFFLSIFYFIVERFVFELKMITCNRMIKRIEIQKFIEPTNNQQPYDVLFFIKSDLIIITIVVCTYMNHP